MSIFYAASPQVQRVQRVQKVQRVMVAASRQYVASFPRKAEALQRASEPGSCVSIACTLSEHLNARPLVAPLGDRG
jgi:hypothetical protein